MANETEILSRMGNFEFLDHIFFDKPVKNMVLITTAICYI